MTLTDLSAIKTGDRFTHAGLVHEALSDASTFERFGFRNVHIQTKRNSGNTRSGWELCTVAEYERAA